jgi:pseudaminic acid cytidylyltransferase
VSTIAIIPARGGSKRIPGKNIKQFHGKPMLAYAIAAARHSGLFARIVVSSDDNSILRLASELGATSLARPAHLADDHTPTVPVIAHAIEATERETKTAIEAACCIYPSVPFLDPFDLCQAKQLAAQTGERYVFPVVAFPSSIHRAIRRTSEGVAIPLFPENVLARTQDMSEAFYDAGQFYWANRNVWLRQLPVHANGTTLVVPAWRAIDIDTAEDWYMAELLYQALKLPSAK